MQQACQFGETQHNVLIVNVFLFNTEPEWTRPRCRVKKSDKFTAVFLPRVFFAGLFCAATRLEWFSLEFSLLSTQKIHSIETSVVATTQRGASRVLACRAEARPTAYWIILKTSVDRSILLPASHEYGLSRPRLASPAGQVQLRFSVDGATQTMTWPTPLTGGETRHPKPVHCYCPVLVWRGWCLRVAARRRARRQPPVCCRCGSLSLASSQSI